MNITCPGCSAQFTVPANALGKRVRCLKCKEIVKVPAGDLDEDKPTRSRPEPEESGTRRPKEPSDSRRDDRQRDGNRRSREDDRPERVERKSGSGLLLLVLALVAFGGLVVLGFVGVTFYVYFRGSDPENIPVAAGPGNMTKTDLPGPPAKADPGPGPAKAISALQPKKTHSVDLRDILNFSLSPDGSVVGLAGVGPKQPGGKEEHLSVFYDLSNGNRVGMPIELNGPGVLSDGGRSTAFTDFGELFVRNISTGEQASLGKEIKQYAFSPDGKLVVTAVGPKLSFRPWPATGEPKEVTPESPVIGLSNVFQQGTRVATVHNDAKGVVLRVWDVKAGVPTEEVSLGRPKIAAKETRHRLAIADDGRAMVVTTEQGAHEVWDLPGKKKLGWTGNHLATSFLPVTGGLVCFITTQIKIDGGQVSRSMFVSVVNLQSGDAVHRLEFPSGVESFTGSQLGVAADGKRYVSWSDDTKKLYVWDLPGRVDVSAGAK